MYSKINFTRDYIENKIIMFNKFIVSNYLKLYPKIEESVIIVNDFLETYFFELYSLFIIIITLLFITMILYYSNLYQALLQYKTKHIMSLSLELDKYRKYIIQLQNKVKELEYSLETEIKSGMKKRKLDTIKEISETPIRENSICENPILIHPQPRRRISLTEQKKK